MDDELKGDKIGWFLKIYTKMAEGYIINKDGERSYIV